MAAANTTQAGQGGSHHQPGLSIISHNIAGGSLVINELIN